MLTIRMFGTLEAIKGEEEPIRRFRSRTAAEVLALLSVSLPRVLPRDEVAAIVWPEDETEQARQSFRTAISSLRKQLGVEGQEDYFAGDRHSLGLDPRRVDTDYAQFNRLVSLAPPQQGNLRDALQLVRGPLLQGIDASWTIPHQLAFEEAYCRTVVNLIESLTRDGSASVAIEIGRAALQICPLREDVHVALIRSFGAAGKNADAIRQFEVLEHLLMDQWGEYPSQDAVAAIESLGRRPARRPRPAPPGDEALALQIKQGWVFGREREVGEVLMALQDGGPEADRLLTLVGAGGSGKTTIARVVQESLSEVMPVAFVDLAPLKEVALAVSATARSLGLANPNRPDAVDRVRNHLANERVVLILDNAEHLPGFEKVIEMWHAQKGSSRILVTSRAALGLRQERLFPVPPLALPRRDGTLAELSENPCIRLFVDRARAVDADFELTSQNAQAVGEICIGLDGVPLAIELAASQVLVMSPAQILKRLGDERFRLKAHTRDPGDRHASLDRVARWSYDLLLPTDQTVFRRLGIFRSDFSLDAAEAVSAEPDAAESLGRLVRCSLLERRVDGESVRFRMLIPLRTFALECLRQADDEEASRGRHRDHFEGVAFRLRETANSPDPSPAFREFEQEHDQFRQIIDYAQGHRTWAGPTMRIAFAIGSLLTATAYQYEWRSRMLEFMGWASNTADVDGHDMALGCFATGQFAGYAYRSDLAVDWVERGLPLFEAHWKPVDVAGCLNLLGLCFVLPGPSGRPNSARSLDALERAREILQGEVGDSLWKASHLKVAILANLAAAYRTENRYPEGIAFLEEALSCAKRAGVTRYMPTILTALADHHNDSGQPDAGEQYARQSIEAHRILGLDTTAGHFALAASLQGLGRHIEAVRLLTTPGYLSQLRERTDTPGISMFLLALSAHHLGNPTLRDLAYQVAQRLGFPGYGEPRGHVPSELHERTVHLADLKPGDPEVLEVYRAFLEAYGEGAEHDPAAQFEGA